MLSVKARVELLDLLEVFDTFFILTLILVEHSQAVETTFAALRFLMGCHFCCFFEGPFHPALEIIR